MQPKIHRNRKRITTLWAVTLNGYFSEVSVLQRRPQTWPSLLERERENAIEACGLFCSTRLSVFRYYCCLLLRFERYLCNSTEIAEDMHVKGRWSFYILGQESVVLWCCSFDSCNQKEVRLEQSTDDVESSVNSHLLITKIIFSLEFFPLFAVQVKKASQIVQ